MGVIKERGNVTCQETLKILGVLSQKKRSLRDNMAKGQEEYKRLWENEVSNLFSLVGNGRVWDVTGSTGPNKIHIRY